MSKFNTLMENHLNKTDLLRIRIKHDPANGIDEMNDYVGYVLEEDGMGGVVAIVPSMGPDPMSLGPEQFEPDQPCGDPLGRFKKHVVEYLMAKGYHEHVSSAMEHIINAKNVVELENLVQTCGCDSTAVLNLYRDYVSNEAV